MDEIVEKMMDYVCDSICRHPWEQDDQEQMSAICDSCQMEMYVSEILNTYNRLNDFDKSQCMKLLQELARLKQGSAEVRSV